MVRLSRSHSLSRRSATRLTAHSPASAPHCRSPRHADPEKLKATILRENLKRGLAMVLYAAAAKSTLPVLSDVLLETTGTDRLKISATNLEIGIVVWVGAQVEWPRRRTGMDAEIDGV